MATTPPTLEHISESSTIEISILYSSLFVLSVLLYFYLRVKFPRYYILRTHGLNEQYVNYLFQRKEGEAFYPTGRNTGARDVEDGAQSEAGLDEPLLQNGSEALNPFAYPEDLEGTEQDLPEYEDESSASVALGTVISTCLVNFWAGLSSGISSLFSVCFYSDEEIIKVCGLDQMLILRLIRLIILLLVAFNIPGLGMLLPLYQSQEQEPFCEIYCERFGFNVSEDAFSARCICSIIDKSSLAMVKCSSDLRLGDKCLPLWGPVVAMYWCSGITLWLLRREYKKIIELRNRYWLCRPPQMYTILVDEIPPHLKLSTRDSLWEHFDSIFPGHVISVDIVASYGETNRILSRLRKCSEKRAKIVQNLEHALAEAELYPEKPVVHYICKLSNCTREEVDSIQYYSECLKEANEEFTELKNQYIDASKEFEPIDGEMVCSSAFVTFNSVVASTVAEQSLIHHQKDIVAVRAPDPADIRWWTIGYRETALTFRRYIAQILFVIIVLFWGTLTTVISGFTNPDALKKEFPWISDVYEDYHMFIDMITPLVLIALIAVVNPIMRGLAMIFARASDSQVERIATMWYFYFLVVQVFLFYGISGTVFKTIQESLDHPKTLLNTLAETIPKNASFYVQFIVAKMFTMLAQDLLRTINIFQAGLRRLFCGPDYSPRDYATVKCGCSPLSLAFHNNMISTTAWLLVTFFIATTYIAIQPLIAPTALIFFMFAYLVYGTNFLNLTLQKYDTGGTQWPNYYWCILSAVFAAQITTVAVLVVKQGVQQVFAMWILIAFTGGASNVLSRRYKKLASSIPLSTAQKIDNLESDNLHVAPRSLWHHNTLTEPPCYLNKEPIPSFYFDGRNTDNEQDPLREPSSVPPIEVFSYELPVLKEVDEYPVPTTSHMYQDYIE